MCVIIRLLKIKEIGNMTDTITSAKQIRRYALQCINSQGSGHIGGTLSIADVLAVLYDNHMNVDPANPQLAGRDRLVLSKGHAGPALYATLCHKGFFPESWLLTLNQLGTKLPSHCNMILTPGVDMTAGSLGQGLSGATGLALASKMSGDNAHIYVICGDGELQEGQNWEAIMYLGAKKIDNVILFVDHNGLQIDGTNDDVVAVEDLCAKFSAFGWDTVRINGHDHSQIDDAINNAKQAHAPVCIVMDTIKGRGVSFYEAMGASNHSTNCTNEQLALALAELV